MRTTGGHVFASLQVGRVGISLGQGLGDQFDGAQCQCVGDRRAIYRQISFDGVDQGIHATGGGDAARTGQGHGRADQGDIRQQVVADDALFQLRLLVGKDRDAGHFRAGAGGGRNGDQGRALLLDQVDAEQLGQRAVMPGEGRDAFGDVNGAAASEADQAVIAAFVEGAGAVFYDGDLRFEA